LSYQDVANGSNISPNKPKKWGFKVIARCGVSGITYDFLLYGGQSPRVQPSCGFMPGDLVLKLCETLEKQKNFKLYFDNFYNFPELQLLLKEYGFWSVGTLRSNRTRGCPLKSDKKLQKDGRGASEMYTDATSGLNIVKWFDNRVVHVSSIHRAIDPVKTVQRWDRKQKKHIEV
jgi:hypothetical protein